MAEIRIRLDDRAWFRLATLAEQRGKTIAEVIELELRKLAPVPEPKPQMAKTSRGDQVRERVAELHAQGLNDLEIATIMHCSQSTVWHHRRVLRLASNYRRAA